MSERPIGLDCTCTPCESPGRGHPGIDHCAACCAGSLIEEYDHSCPIAEHRDMAELQFPTPVAIGSVSMRAVPTPDEEVPF